MGCIDEPISRKYTTLAKTNNEETSFWSQQGKRNKSENTAKTLELKVFDIPMYFSLGFLEDAWLSGTDSTCLLSHRSGVQGPVVSLKKPTRSRKKLQTGWIQQSHVNLTIDASLNANNYCYRTVFLPTLSLYILSTCIELYLCICTPLQLNWPFQLWKGKDKQLM